ncbi:Hypoxanthine phosphoribosyltransferase [Eubacterium plexicaudatum ASF492]|uniref:Hypoxanthine phosphoribosyltransferase n=1 Tax=Eubacterium plexicaudatum ASF492 TaxID=1235802 RepID=N2A1H1_9FIRM|nr:Hypoxanthine phosphoribosyltransferase [Eubacterium plexicaudatum ASF492]
MISEEEVNARITEIAARISEDYKGEEIVAIGILRGGVYFCTELTKKITVPVILDFMEASSYGDGTDSSGQVLITKDLIEDIADRNVIVVEDIIDTGRTLSLLLDNLRARKPKSLKLCTLLDKPQRRVVPVQVDYNGFVIPNKFVIGYGMDYAQKYRNLPYIGVVEGE